MAIVRVVKDKENPYVVLNKTCIEDANLTWQAKGLHTYLISKPDNWQVYISDLKNRSKNGRDATANIIRELIEAGYIKRIHRRDENTNKMLGGYDYEVYEIPLEEPQKLKPRKTDSPKTEVSENRTSRKSENPKLINNELKINNETNKLIISYYQKHIGVITPNLSIKLLSFLEDGMESDVIISAIDEAVGSGVRNFNYLLKILNNWMDMGIKEGAQLTEHQKKYKNKKSTNNIINQNNNYNYSEVKTDGKCSKDNDSESKLDTRTQKEMDKRIEESGIDWSKY